MGIMYECSHCEQEMDSVLDGATVIYNAHRDDDVVCDDCMNDIADSLRAEAEYRVMAAKMTANMGSN